jgi:NAD(P)-dependent dehydrogenase (short-subunit alcohol dehydrogenase family)
MAEQCAYNFAGKVALVCGAGAGGIGTATSTKLAEAGALVVAVDRTDDLVEETIDALKSLGGQCLGITADLREPRQVAAILPAALKVVGRIDLLANIAGGTKIDQWARLEELSDEIFDDVMALNLGYVFRICRDVGLHMIQQQIRGSIVNISSVSALNSAPYHSIYGAAKRAVVALTESMAIEWGGYGIRANTIAPGHVRTRRTTANGTDLDRLAKTTPLERPVEMQEIADAIMFLFSDHASAITGQQISVDCGLSKNCATGLKSEFQQLVRR